MNAEAAPISLTTLCTASSSDDRNSCHCRASQYVTSVSNRGQSLGRSAVADLVYRILTSRIGSTKKIVDLDVLGANPRDPPPLLCLFHTTAGQLGLDSDET